MKKKYTREDRVNELMKIHKELSERYGVYYDEAKVRAEVEAEEIEERSDDMCEAIENTIEKYAYIVEKRDDDDDEKEEREEKKSFIPRENEIVINKLVPEIYQVLFNAGRLTQYEANLLKKGMVPAAAEDLVTAIKKIIENAKNKYIGDKDNFFIACNTMLTPIYKVLVKYDKLTKAEVKLLNK